MRITRVGPQNQSAGQPIELTFQAGDSDGVISGWIIDWGDNATTADAYEDRCGPPPGEPDHEFPAQRHTYRQIGEYQITVRVVSRGTCNTGPIRAPPTTRRASRSARPSSPDSCSSGFPGRRQGSLGGLSNTQVPTDPYSAYGATPRRCFWGGQVKIKLLVIAAAVVSLLASSAAPAHAAKTITAVKTNISDCPYIAVAAAVQPRVGTSQPLNLGFGIEIGQHKGAGNLAATKCATPHTLSGFYYLYLLPITGPRSLVAIGNATGHCRLQCTDLLSFTSVVAPPGIYEVVADIEIDGALATSLTTPNFLYTGLEIEEFDLGL